MSHATLFGSPEGTPQAAYARGQRAGPAFPGARAGLRPGPSPRRAAQVRPPNAPSLRLRGRKQGGGCASAAPPPHPQGRPRSYPHHGPNSEQQQVFLGKICRRREWGPGLPGSAAGGGRCTHRAPTGGQLQVLASPGRKTPPTPPLPEDSRADAAATEPENRERRTAASARARTGW